MTDSETIRLVLRAQAEDRDAIEKLITELQVKLRPFVSGIAGPTGADDVLQDTLIQICRDIKWLRQPELISAWSYRIASRCSFKWLKRNRRFSQPDPENFSMADVPAPQSAELHLFTTIPEFLEIASPASRAVLMLHYVHDLPLDQVAAILDISSGTAKSRLAYGLSSLRQYVKRKGIPTP